MVTGPIRSTPGPYCPNCGSRIAPADAACPGCGRDLAGTEPDPTPSDTYPPSGSSTWSVWGEVVDQLRAATQGEYEILYELGRGGMGAVFLAHHAKLDRKVAIKVLAPSALDEPEIVARFASEARVAAALAHPNIATIFAVEHHDRLHYFVMQYLEGPTLQHVLQARGGLSIDMVRALAYQVGEGLAYAHRRGVVHRDIKPANIMISGRGEAVIMDFGIAKAAASPGLTQAGAIMGTPRYMSPEQCSGQPVTAASDQYSFGVVLYELLTGRPPFEGSTPETLIGHVSGTPEPIRSLRPDVPDAMARAVHRMLEKRPDARFADLTAGVTALGGKPLTADDPMREAIAGLGQATTLAAAPRSPTTRGPAAAGPVTENPTLRPRARALPAFVGGLLKRLRAWLTSPRPRDAAKATPPAPSDVGVTVEQPIPSLGNAPESESTAVYRPVEWAPSPAATAPRPDEPDNATQVLVGPDAEGATATDLPVALSITSAPDPALIGTRAPCRRLPFSIGRSERADLCISGDNALSRTHVVIARDAAGFVISDSSTNGVYVNGRHLQGAAEPIYFGSTIVLSRATSLRFVADVPLLPDLTRQVIAERYGLEELMHQSIKAVTYISQDLRVQRRVALKIFSPTLMTLARYRAEFDRQATLAAKLQHPHICKVIDVGEAALTIDGRRQPVSYLCTELMEGGNLAARLEADPPPSLAEITRWIESVATALDHAHRNGIVHADLKPNCIVFDREGTPYLTDFALARAHEATARPVVGTPDYLAPEQWEGQPPSGATDQYSLAVLAYQLVTGVRPHEGQSDPTVRARNLRRGPPPAHEEARVAGRDAVPATLSAVLAQAMRVEPGERYPAVLEFSRAFADAVAHPNRRSAEPRVFLSYQRQTSGPWAILFSNELKERHGCSAFVDTQAQDGAPQIPTRIRNEIESADVFVCFLNPDTLSSRWVRQEIEIAFRCGKPMVPIFQEKFRPKDLTEPLDPSVRALLDHDAVHLLDERGIYYDQAIAELAKRVRRLLS